MPRQQGKLPRLAAVQACLKPNVLEAVCVPSPWLRLAGQQSINQFQLQWWGELAPSQFHWEPDVKSLNSFCKLKQRLIGTSVPHSYGPAWSCATSLQVKSSLHQPWSSEPSHPIPSHSQPTLHTLEPAPICLQRNEQKHFLLSSLVWGGADASLWLFFLSASFCVAPSSHGLFIPCTPSHLLRSSLVWYSISPVLLHTKRRGIRWIPHRV